MAKITRDDVNKTLLMGYEAFGFPAEHDYALLIDEVISEVSSMLSGILGSMYDATTEPTQSFVKKTELYLVCAELIQRRINKLLANVTGAGQELDTKNEQMQMEKYRDEAERMIDILLGGDGISFEVLNTSHFERTKEQACA